MKEQFYLIDSDLCKFLTFGLHADIISQLWASRKLNNGQGIEIACKLSEQEYKEVVEFLNLQSIENVWKYIRKIKTDPKYKYDFKT